MGWKEFCYYWNESLARLLLINIKMISNDVTRWCAEFRGWRGSRRWSLSGCQRTPAFLYYFINTFPSPASYTLCYLAYTCILYSLAWKPEFLWSKPCLHLHLIYSITCLYLQTQLYYTFVYIVTYTLHTNRHCFRVHWRFYSSQCCSVLIVNDNWYYYALPLTTLQWTAPYDLQPSMLQAQGLLGI